MQLNSFCQEYFMDCLKCILIPVSYSSKKWPLYRNIVTILSFLYSSIPSVPDVHFDQFNSSISSTQPNLLVPSSIFELKLDGIRCIAYCDSYCTDLRNKRDVKLIPRFPELKDLHKQCNEKCILDGE